MAGVCSLTWLAPVRCPGNSATDHLMRRVQCTVISKTVGNPTCGSWPLYCWRPVGKGLGVPEKMEPRAGIKAWPSRQVFGSITPLPDLLALIVFAFSDLMKKGNTLQSCAFKQVAGRPLPLRSCSDHQYGHFSSCDDTGGCLPSRPHLALKEPCVESGRQDRVLALDKMEWPLPAVWCLLYPALSAYYPAT